MDFGDIFAIFAHWWEKNYLPMQFTLFGVKTDVVSIFMFSILAAIFIKFFRWLKDG